MERKELRARAYGYDDGHVRIETIATQTNSELFDSRELAINKLNVKMVKNEYAAILETIFGGGVAILTIPEMGYLINSNDIKLQAISVAAIIGLSNLITDGLRRYKRNRKDYNARFDSLFDVDLIEQLDGK